LTTGFGWVLLTETQPLDRSAGNTSIVSRNRRRKRAKANREAEATVTRVEAAPPPPSAADGQKKPTSLVELLNTRTGTATAAAASVLGVLLALAPILGPSAVLAAIGVPLLAWGGYQLALSRRALPVRIVGAGGCLIVVTVLALVSLRQVVEPDATEFVYDGSLLAPNDYLLAGEAYPPLTADPAEGRKVDILVEPASLVVSCWVVGRYQGKGELIWVSIVDGDYRSLWVPLSSLGAMARGAARTLLPCSDWRWRIQRFP
jgi:hypothetical protein